MASAVGVALLGGELGDAKSCPRRDPRGCVWAWGEAGGELVVAEGFLGAVA